jgi:hypothetical protein
MIVHHISIVAYDMRGHSLAVGFVARLKAAPKTQGRWRMKVLARIALHAASAILFIVASFSTAATTILTSADPADGWRVIAPVGNLEGLPITAVGLDWEAANGGWNSSSAYDDSDAAGWHTPVARDESAYGATLGNNVWADEEGMGLTPAYFRKLFFLPVLPTAAWFGSNIPNDFSNVVDDDVQIYINGALVFDDTDGQATFYPVIDILGYLQLGDNLIAMKAHDSFTGNEHVSFALQAVDVPEPGGLLLVLSAVGALCLSRRRFGRTSRAGRA